MRKRPTPETDAVAAYEGNWDTKALRMTAHSRKLERERDELREVLREIMAYDDIKRERDELRELLKKCREDSICYAEHMRKCGYSEAYRL